MPENPNIVATMTPCWNSRNSWNAEDNLIAANMQAAVNANTERTDDDTGETAGARTPSGAIAALANC